ncbi:unnamed protein product [Orchesella dallaii]|uniref:Disease resistance R13L4/SHOC-2-like LRR domain-containing protein n=1 Tax=Orchesella dallaii TaxID=48710 RepID=A0ABP1S3Q7_9HEXA
MNSAPVSCNFVNSKMTRTKKILDEAREIKNPELDLVEKGLATFDELPGLLSMEFVTRLTLSHNKIRSIPSTVANLVNLEILTLFNNQLEELPTAISSLPKLRILNVGLNRLTNLGRGFGACPSLEILDVTHNKLSEEGLPGNFWMMETLRALYMGDNYFENISPEIGKLRNLQILVLRNNNINHIPRDIGNLTRLREFHIQGNTIQWLPPEIANLDLGGGRSIIRIEDNPLAPPLADQWILGAHHLLEFVKTDAYKSLYGNAHRTRR